MVARSAEADAAAAVRAGDESAFAGLVERHRRELQVHCYRMLGSFEDSEDVVQETFLRAWRKRRSFEGRSSFRTWLYRIATNACLDLLARRPRARPRRDGSQPLADVAWLQPYPDRLLEGVESLEDGPEGDVVARETVELAFVAAIQVLPPRQRAVLIARDVLGLSAAETASLLDVTVAAVNSALQRARASMREHLPERRLDWPAGGERSEEQRELLRRYMDATERADTQTLVALLREDALFAMPPAPEWYRGAEEIVAAWVSGGFGSPEFGDFRCVPTRANGQPAVAAYLRRPGDDAYRPFALDVLRIEDGAIADVITFPLEPYVEALGVPREL